MMKAFRFLIMAVMAFVMAACNSSDDPEPEPFSQSCDTPLTFEWFDDNSGELAITCYRRGYLWYKVDDGEWILCNGDDIIIPLTKNQTVMFRGENAANFEDICTHIFANGNCYIYGNIMSLIKGAKEDWGNMVEEDLSAANTLEFEHTFEQLFCYEDNGKYLYNHPSKELLLPATSLTPYCYNMMFMGCSNLERTPELPASIVPYYGYCQMFSGCTKLNYIKCLATDISAEHCTDLWVYDVARNGTFVVNSSLTVTGDSPTYKTVWGDGQNFHGIPNGDWTVTNTQ